MKTIIAAVCLATCAGLAAAADGYRVTAGDSDADAVVRIQLGDASDNTYYRNQAGQPDLHQPQVG
jgi:hypothetical protein